MIQALRTLISYTASLIIALVLAVIIWGVAVQENDVNQRRLIDIPVQLIGLPPDSEIENAPRIVQIQVEGPTSRVDGLSGNDFSAVLDVTESPAGASTLPIIVTHNDALNAQLITTLFQIPETVEVTIERIITKEVQVVVDVTGSVPLGYETGTVFIDPPTIQITGRASRVEQIDQARAEVFLDDPQEDASFARRASFFSANGEQVSVSGLDVTSRDIQITVAVNQLTGFAAKPIIVRWEGSPPQGYRLLDVKVEPDNLLVTGRPNQLELLQHLPTEVIDVTGLRETAIIQAVLEVPDGIEIVDLEPIFVTFEIEPIVTTDLITVEPEISGLSEGLTTTLDIEEIDVFLGGPFDKIQSLTTNDVRVTLDLFGLDVGMHTIEPVADVFVSDVEVRSLQPPVVTINITRVMTMTEEITGTETLTETSLVPLPLTQVVSSSPLLTMMMVSAPVAAIPAGIALTRIKRN